MDVVKSIGIAVKSVKLHHGKRDIRWTARVPFAKGGSIRIGGGKEKVQTLGQ